MIKNEKQKNKSIELIENIEKKIQLSKNKSEIISLNTIKREIHNELKEYLDVKSGKTKNFILKNILDIPKILINARIAKNLSQKDLAEIVGISQQQLHRWESTDYENASFWRVVDISEALEVCFNINASLEEDYNNSETLNYIFLPKFDFQVISNENYQPQKIVDDSDINYQTVYSPQITHQSPAVRQYH